MFVVFHSTVVVVVDNVFVGGGLYIIDVVFLVVLLMLFVSFSFCLFFFLLFLRFVCLFVWFLNVLVNY